MSSRKQIKENGFSVVFIKTFKAAAAGVFISALLLLLFSFIMSKKDLPLFIINPFCSLLLCTACFISGYVAAKEFKKRGMLVGSACGIIIYLLLMIMSFTDNFSIGITAIIKLFIATLSGAAGGVLGVNAKRVRK